MIAVIISKFFKGKLWSQLPTYSRAQARSISSNVWMVLSDWPSDWRWKAMLMHNSVPITDWKPCQNFETNLVSQSDIINKGIQCNCTISFRYKSANCSALNTFFIAKKWADLVSRSTTTQIASCRFWVLGNPTIKSMVIWSHFQMGIGKGCHKPPGFWCSVVTLWQIRHRATYSAMSFFIRGHQ